MLSDAVAFLRGKLPQKSCHTGLFVFVEEDLHICFLIEKKYMMLHLSSVTIFKFNLLIVPGLEDFQNFGLNFKSLMIHIQVLPQDCQFFLF